MFLNRRKRRGFTLVELIIAVAIAALTSLAFMASIIYMIRESRDNREHFYALQVMNVWQGKVRAANPRRIGDNHLAGATNRLMPSEFEFRFTANQDMPLRIPNNPFDFNANIANTPAGHTASDQDFRLWFAFTGWGFVSAADLATNVITVTIPPNQRRWVDNEWVGSYFEFVEGPGAGQMFVITANTANSVTVNTDLTLATAGIPIQVPPTNETRFMINNSRQVEMFLEWGDGQNHRQLRRTILIPENI